MSSVARPSSGDAPDSLGGKLRAVFLGTPEFAVPSLRALLAAAEVVAVVTQPDRPKGRGRQVAAPPVARAARELGLRVLQPAKVKDPQTIRALAELRPDVIVTVAYGRIIPKDILELPPLGCVNVHPSLLPRYRGASPIQHAIMDGNAETGVTIMYQSEALDAGDIILQRRVPIRPDDTAGTLEHALALEGATALMDALRLIGRGEASRLSQDPVQATYVGKLTKEDGRIDWSRSALELERFVRAMDPWPSAHTWHRGRLLKIWGSISVEAASKPAGPPVPGSVVDVRRGEGFVVATGDGSLLVREVQPEGRRRMTADEYVRGTHLQVGEKLGTPPL